MPSVLECLLYLIFTFFLWLLAGGGQGLRGGGFLIVGAAAEDGEVLGEDEQGDFLACAESYCLSKNYSKLDVPFNEEGRVDISVDLDVLQILEVKNVKLS